MDWSKAKNILIIAFIVTNMFLFYHVGKDLFTDGALKVVSHDYIMNVEAYLKDERDIHISGEIPREVTSLPIVMVRYLLVDHQETAKLFLGENYTKINETTYLTNNQKLVIESDKKIKYYNSMDDIDSTRISEVVAQQLSNEFLKQRDFLNENILLKQIYYGIFEDFGDTPLFKLVYHQTYNNKFLGESYIHVYINNVGVVGFESLLLKTEKTQQQKKVLIPATEALFKKMNDISKENRGRIIVKTIEIGYYFNPYDIEFADWNFIELGTAVPTWKITLENGKIYYVEALKN